MGLVPWGLGRGVERGRPNSGEAPKPSLDSALDFSRSKTLAPGPLHLRAFTQVSCPSQPRPSNCHTPQRPESVQGEGQWATFPVGQHGGSPLSGSAKLRRDTRPEIGVSGSRQGTRGAQESSWRPRAQRLKGSCQPLQKGHRSLNWPASKSAVESARLQATYR